jgi:hypothetical protein
MPIKLVLIAVLLAFPASAAEQPHTRPVSQLQAVPQPYAQISFQRDGVEVARYHFGKDLRRPFLFPLVGPSGRSVTRMGHPRDPESHSHHNSVWVAHNDVSGVGFWDDRSPGKIVHQRIEAMDEDTTTNTAFVQSVNHWINEKDKNALMLVERRRTTLELLPGNELLLTLDLRLSLPPNQNQPVTFGKTPFGMVGVRMAKTIGTLDGGGVIRNSEGQVNEQQVFWKPAKWCDYSGPMTPSATEGATLFDHPENPHHPTVFHVRGDGWMGASLTQAKELQITRDQPLQLRFGLYVHAGMPALETLERHWKTFAQSKRPDLSAAPKR